jgi:hypothetical protein
VIARRICIGVATIASSALMVWGTAHDAGIAGYITGLLWGAEIAEIGQE